MLENSPPTQRLAFMTVSTYCLLLTSQFLLQFCSVSSVMLHQSTEGWRRPLGCPQMTTNFVTSHADWRKVFGRCRHLCSVILSWSSNKNA